MSSNPSHADRRLFMIVACVVILVMPTILPAQADGQRTQGVSPGSVTLAQPLATSCPTFSWGGIPQATGYELVLYEVGDDGSLETALRTTVAGDARAWTPAATECPTPGAQHAWAVRALTDDGARTWSEPLLFQTPGTPTEDEVRQALDTLRRYRDVRVDEPDRRPQGMQASGDHPAESTPTGARAESRRLASASYGPDEPALLEREALTNATTATGPSPQVVTAPPSFSLSLDGDLQLNGGLFRGDLPFMYLSHTMDGNSAFGLNALISSTPGSPTVLDGRSNTAGGYRALRNNTSGDNNTANGRGALEANTTGDANTAMGARALGSNSSGCCNTAVGRYALSANTTGHRNTASGMRALWSNVDGYANTADGYLALSQNTSGAKNTANGLRALAYNEGGDLNTASGYRALWDNITGNENTAIGANALRSNTGSKSTAVGSRALYANTTGHHNVAVGYDALEDNETGFYNTAVGTWSLRNTTSGDHNVAVGRGAGINNTTGNSNIFINANGVSTDANVLRIGNGTGTGTKQLNQAFISGVFGKLAASGVNVVINSENQLGTTTSSARFKQDIHELQGMSAKLQELRPVSFRYKDELMNLSEGQTSPQEYGLIAEEVAKVFPELVVYDEEGRPFTVRYQLLAPLLLAEVQDLNQRLVGRDRRLAELEREQENVARELAALRRRVAGVE